MKKVQACSISSSCCDSSFSIGGVRPSELSIKVRIDLPEVNSYTLYGAKIKIHTTYGGADSEYMLRGEYWITSAKRTKTVYTIRASDAIIWLDSGSYVSCYGQTTSESDNPIYKAWCRHQNIRMQ